MKTLIYICLLATLLSCGRFQGDHAIIEYQSMDNELGQELQRILDSLLLEKKGTGISASVILPDNEIWSGTCGVSSGDSLLTTGMLFGIGSVTKNFTAALTLKLVEEGKLSLEDPVKKWLPGFPNIDNSITVSQLLNHTSGVGGFFNNEEIWTDLLRDKARTWTPEEVLGYVGEPYFKPGEGCHYVNTNYILLGLIILKATGVQKISTLYREILWDPLGLDNTYLDIEEKMPDRLAHAYSDIYNKKFGSGNPGVIEDVSNYPRTAHNSIVWTAGGIYSTPTDLAKWTDALFSGLVLEQSSMDEMLNFIPVPDDDGHGMGIFSYSPGYTCDRKSIGHSGQNTGYMTEMIYLKEDDITLVFSINNQDYNLFSSIAGPIIKAVLEYQKN